MGATRTSERRRSAIYDSPRSGTDGPLDTPERRPEGGCPPELRHTRVCSFDGTEIDVQSVGNGPPIVVANGLGGSMRAWGPLLEHFAPSYQLVSWDYRGLYASGRPPRLDAVRVGDHCGDLRVVLDHFGGTPAVVIGWSMGVQVAVQFALDHPTKVVGLVLVCGAPGDPFGGVLRTTFSRRGVPVVCRLVEAGPAPFGTLVRALAALPLTPKLLLRIGVVAPSCDLGVLRVLARDLAQLDWRLYARTMRSMGRHDAWSRLGEIRAPVLAVGGTRDLVTPPGVAEAVAAAVPQGDSLLIEGATHYAPLEFPDELNVHIDRFLSQHLPATRHRGRSKPRGLDR